MRAVVDVMLAPTLALNSLDWPRIDALVARRDVTKACKLLRTDGVPSNVRWAPGVSELSVGQRDTRHRWGRPAPTAVQTQLHTESLFLPCGCHLECATVICLLFTSSRAHLLRRTQKVTWV